MFFCRRKRSFGTPERRNGEIRHEIAAARLMANLQASLRSQTALAFDPPEALLRSVNRLFYDNYDNTGDSASASGDSA
jgi:hypothetical protein